MTDEYSVGPLDNGTWLVLYEMTVVACENADEAVADEYREARKAFLDAHPEDAIGSFEDWPESMKQAWNETIMEEIRDV